MAFLIRHRPYLRDPSLGETELLLQMARVRRLLMLLKHFFSSFFLLSLNPANAGPVTAVTSTRNEVVHS